MSATTTSNNGDSSLSDASLSRNVRSSISHDDDDDDTSRVVLQGVRSTGSASARSHINHHHHECTPTTSFSSPLSREVGMTSNTFTAAESLSTSYTSSLHAVQRLSASSASSRNMNAAASIVLQDMTVNKLQFDKLHFLYGRTEQVNELKQVVCKMSQLRRHLVLIQGDAGSGKSTLAMSVLHNNKQQQQDHQSIMFAKGKFDVTLKDEPYSGIGEACRDLVANLLVQIEVGGAARGAGATAGGFVHPDNNNDKDGGYDSDTRRKRSNSSCIATTFANEVVADLRTALGQDARLLHSLIPNLHLLLDHNTGPTAWNDAVATATTTSGRPRSQTADDRPDPTSAATTEPGSKKNTNEGYAEAKTRFQHAFRRFIRALSTSSSSSSINYNRNTGGSSSRKLIFILDDIHWADACSLELLEAVLTDTENKTGSLLVIATFRSEQVSSDLNHFIQRIDLTRTQGSYSGYGPGNGLQLFGHTAIELDNWQISDLTAMLADLLNESRSENVLPLAECVHRKTRGNIFFSIQFLRALAETGRLKYQFGLCKWTWDDPADILQQTSSTDNVIQLLTEKLKVLPNDIYKLLPAIACLGSQFRGFVVEFIVAHWNEFFGDEGHNIKAQDEADGVIGIEHPAECTIKNQIKTVYKSEEVVNTLVDLGLIVVIGQDQCRWEHDKVQEAALGLMTQLELAELKYIVGDILLDKLTKSQLEEMLFVVSDLVDQHPDPATLPKEKRERIRELNLDAGRKARESSAFYAASVYLRRGIQLLDTDCWITDYDSTLDVYSASAEANFCAGNVNDMKHDCKTVFANATRSFVDKRRAYNCLLYSTLALDAVQDTQDLCLELLARLGCTFPKRMRTFHVLSGALRINASVDKTIEKVDSLKKIQKLEDYWVVYLLDILSICAYHNDDNTFMPLVLIESLRSTLRYGLSDKSPIALVDIALLLVSLGNLKGAKSYCDKAMELLKVYPGCSTRTIFLANYFVLHWQLPFELCMKPLLDTFHMGLKLGDLDSAAWSAYCYAEMTMHGGRNLQSLFDDCKEFCARVLEVKQLKILNNIKLVWQLALCLHRSDDSTANDLFLSDDNRGVVTHNELRLWIDENKDENLRQQVTRNRMHAKFWLGDYEGMAKMIVEHKTDRGAVEEYHPATFIIPPLYLQCAVCCFTLFRQTRRKSLKKSGLWFTKKIHAWAKKGNPNVMFGAALLDAEVMSLVGILNKTDETACKKKYESAIYLAARRGCFHDHALAQELYGAFCLRQGDTDDARYHTQRAIDIYDEWGAKRVASLLRGKHDLYSSNATTLPQQEEQQT